LKTLRIQYVLVHSLSFSKMNDRTEIYRFIVSWGVSPSKDNVLNRSIVRSYLRRPEVSAAIDGSWTRTGELIAQKITAVPWILAVCIECRLCNQYIHSMLSTILRDDNVDSFTYIVSSPYAQLYTNTDITYVWKYHVPYMKTKCLDYYLQIDGLHIDPDIFMKSIETLSYNSFTFILQHPRHSYLLYALQSPYDYITKKVRSTYTYEKCIEDPYIYGVYRIRAYEDAEAYIVNTRKQKRERLWRILTWLSILHSRMVEFRERYYAPGGPKYKNAELEFNALKN
jgi:hypothetical protein